MQPAASAKPEEQPPPAKPPEPAAVEAHGEHAHTALSTLVIGALGVVFGDIGTSPLYALKECVDGEHGVAPTHNNILGVLSLIVWSLIAVVAVKYLTFIMKADNKREGGILALLAGGTASDACGIRVVQVALQERVRRGCRTLTADGHWVRTRRCRSTPPVAATATGTSRWSWRSSARLRRGTYRVLVRAVDGNGNAGPWTVAVRGVEVR